MKQILTFLFFIPFTVITQSLSDIDFGTDSTFDVITWNIEHFPKNGTITTDSIAVILSSLKADLIACQEIDDTVLFNSMVSSIPNYSTLYDPNNFEGLAYIYNTNTVQITDDYSLYTSGNYWRPFPRAPYLLKVLFQDKQFIIINNHLKCCGNGSLDLTDIDDEENRRLEASTLLESYISNSFANSNVILLGDLNDELTDAAVNNVFNPFFNLPNEYVFVDQPIANGTSSNWSYPSWPSHLDHILITDELFSSFNHPASEVLSIRIDDYLPNGFSDYDSDISDHRPVGLKLFIDTNLLAISAQQSILDINVYPNPATNTVTIITQIEQEKMVVTVTNITGSMVFNRSYYSSENNIQIDISTLKSGIYFVSVIDGQNKSSTRKIIIE